MVESNSPQDNKLQADKGPNSSQAQSVQCKKLASTGKTFKNLLDELYNPLDSINRFINLALQSVAEDSQSRQFLIESKEGIRKTSTLLKKLNQYVEKFEKELCEISAVEE